MAHVTDTIIRGDLDIQGQLKGVSLGVSDQDVQDAVGSLRADVQHLARIAAQHQHRTNSRDLDYPGGFLNTYHSALTVVSKTTGLPINGTLSTFATGATTEQNRAVETNVNFLGTNPRNLRWMPPTGLVAAEFYDGSVDIFDPATMSRVAQTSSGEQQVGVAWDPDSQRLVKGGGNGRPEIYDHTNGNRTEFGPASNTYYGVGGVAWMSNPKRIAVGFKDSPDMRIYDSSLNYIETVTLPITGRYPDTTAIAYDRAHGRLAVSARESSNTYHVLIYDNNLNLMHDFPKYNSRFCLAFDEKNTGLLAASESDGGGLEIFDPETGNSYNLQYGFPGGLSWGPTGWLLAGSYLYKPPITPNKTKSESEAYDADFENIIPTAMHPEDGRIVAGNFDLDYNSNSWVQYLKRDRVISSTYTKHAQFDLAEDGLGAPPTDAVLTHDFEPSLDGSHTLTYTIEDDQGNSVTIGESQIGDVVDVSVLQSRKLQVRVDLDDPSYQAALTGFSVHFT